MTTNRPEFKEHDDFIFEHKKIGKVTREEFIKYIRSSHEHMRKLSQAIQQYNQKIDDFLKEWVSTLNEFEDNERARDLAESERVANEAERISKDSERDSKIDNKADVSELELYAKKEQEDWIEPTMLNGWRGTGGASYQPIQYMKDNLGVVHVIGAFQDGAEQLMFQLPVGYRPSNTRVPVYAKHQWVHGDGVWIEIRNDGRVMVSDVTIPTDTRLFFSCSFYVG